jgi:acetyltransferase-like isoleucine patch superfamily enzyme
MNWVSTYPFRIQWKLEGAIKDGTPATKGDIIIGSDVWLGTDATILSGVTIGHGTVVATRSVVTRDIPPYAMAVGAPARVIRYRFSEDVIKKLLEIQWWEWDDEQIREAIPLLSSPDMHEFLEKYYKRSAG